VPEVAEEVLALPARDQVQAGSGAVFEADH
jgi:hypothetical protein